MIEKSSKDKDLFNQYNLYQQHQAKEYIHKAQFFILFYPIAFSKYKFQTHLSQSIQIYPLQHYQQFNQHQMLDDKPQLEKLTLPKSNSPEKSEPRSDRKIDPEAAKWKSKSLNSLPTEHYEIDIKKTTPPKPTPSPHESKKPKTPSQQNKQKKSTQTGQKILPQPKIKKINQKMFCMTIDNLLKVFYSRMTPKTQTDKNSFCWVDYDNGSNIEFVTGNGSNYIFIGTQNQLIILSLEKKEDKYSIVEKGRKSIPKLRTVTFIGEEMIVVSSELIYQFSLSGNFEPLAKKVIEFKSQNEKKLFHQLKPINLVVQSCFCFYYFGSKIQEKVDYTLKRKFNIDADAKPPSRMSQVLHIVKFQIEHNTDSLQMQKTNNDGSDTGVKKTRYMSQTQLVQSKFASIKTEIFQIDHVFEVGIFDKSKLYELDENIFLMSLHEQIILIKKHFNKYIVWDNVSIVSSKSQEKKGQLILADKRILVYSENGQIFAHDIYFNEEESRINMPPIDSFRGNDNDEEILYDAVLLQQKKDSMMKVLFYFKENDVILPNKSKFRKQPDNPNQQQRDQNKLGFTMLCIDQSEPQEKLKQMLRLKKPPNEIAEFCDRFGIRPLQKTKCMWSVSQKSLKDIENVLLQISDDDYIQLELDNILKKQPHNLTFLISVQTKQIARLKKLIIRNLLNDSATSQMGPMSQFNDPNNPTISKSDYVKKVIQWLMESIMFQKKLKYSQKFLSFKEYDFIEIGKLKAASLKEQIKLLSCKKYEKRLKYFLNSFRILAIANWQEIFTFLLANKNQSQIKQFLIDFSFILPKFSETSSVFQKKGTFGIYSKPNHQYKRGRQLVIKGEGMEKDDEKCELWDDLHQIKNIIKEGILNAGGEPKISEAIEHAQPPLNTIEDFYNMIVENIKLLKKDARTEKEAIDNFQRILGQVKSCQWFNTAAFKQHSMLKLNSNQLQQEFLELRNKKAYQILVQYLYRQIQIGRTDITQDGINRMLDQFVSEYGLIPQSFKKNDDARLKVHKLLMNLRKQNKILFNKSKSEFLIMNQDKYFRTLFDLCRSEILTSIKAHYDQIDRDFFRQRFQIFLESQEVDLSEIIKFIDFFDGSGADDVRVDVFNCIKKLLKITDYENTRDFIDKSLQKEVLPQRSNQISNPDSIDMNVREEAKIPYGFVFHKFFTAFQLNYTYEGLIDATKHSNLATNTFLQQLIRKYCKNEYEITTDFYGNAQCLLEFQDNKILNEKLKPINIHNKPLEFFGFLLYLVDVLDFQVVQKQLYQLIIQNYLNEAMTIESNNYIQSLKSVTSNKFQELWAFVKSLDNYIISAEDYNSKNFQLINSFKDDHDPELIFVEYSINWINRKYSSIQTKQVIEPTLISVKKVLQILQRSNKSSKQIKKMDAFYRLLQFLKKFNQEIMMKIDFIKKEHEEHTGFIFLIHMFREIGVENFRSDEVEQNNGDTLQMHGTKKVSSSLDTNTTIYNWMCIYSQYKAIRGDQTADEKDNPEFIRFVVEVCCIMVAEENYSIAWDLLIRAVNQTYYFRDAFYYLASCLKIQNKLEFTKSFRSFLSTETAKTLKQKLNIMLNGNLEQAHAPGKVLSLPSPTLQYNRGKYDKADLQTVDKKKNALFLFQELIQTNRADEAFFFLVRFKGIRNSQIQKICIDARRLSPLGLKSYLLLASYMKCLEKYISEEFYPTFLFFKSKYEILIDEHERKDIIKDINIAISRLKFRIAEESNQAIKKDLSQYKDELDKYYKNFMNLIEQPYEIRLTQEDEEQATRRIQNYARITPDILEEEVKEQNLAKLKLQQNQEKIQKVHENNKLNVVHKDIIESISIAKQTADKFATILEQKKKQASKMTYAEKKEQQLEEIRRKEQQDVSSIKDSFKSNTTEKVNNLIESVRRKRQMIQQSRYKIEMNREEIEKPSYPFMPQVPQKDQPNAFKKIQARQLPESKYNHTPSYNININSANRLGGQIDHGIIGRASQIIENNKKSYINQNQGQYDLKPSQKFLQIQKKVKGLQQAVVSKPKVTLQEINDIFKNKEPQSLKYLQKFDLVKQSMNVAVELVKRIYSTIKDLSNFLQLLRYLFTIDDRYKEVIEEKAIGIIGQMIRMDQKIQLKQLIPVELFLQVHGGMTLKDYYFKVYEILRPNLRKILAQDKIAAHALGILMRYSLGSETKYFHRVFEDYIRVLLKNYQSKVFDQKETFILAQKLRSQFTNLEQQGREFLFEGLVNEMGNEGKKKRLVDGLKRAVQRKSESAISGGHMEELARAVTRLEKKLSV